MTQHHNYIDFEFAKNVKLGKGRFISKVKRKRPKKHTVNWVKKKYNSWELRDKYKMIIRHSIQRNCLKKELNK